MFRLTRRVSAAFSLCAAALAASSLACSLPSTSQPPTPAPLTTPLSLPSPTAPAPVVTDTVGVLPTATPQESASKTRPQRSPMPEVTSGAEGPAQLTVINDLDVDVCYIFISPTTEDTWGEDWLGSSELLTSGYERTFTMAAGMWDLLATDCDQKELAQKMQVSIQQPLRWWLSTSTIAP